MIPPRALGFLTQKGVDRIPHSGRTLLDHLIGTHDVLSSWNNPAEVCLAGLFHSVYGTERGMPPSVPFDRRHEVTNVIGEEAESIAYDYSILDRRLFLRDLGGLRIVSRLDGRVVPIDATRERRLCELTVANQVEILRRRGGGSEGGLLPSLISGCRPFLSPAALDCAGMGTSARGRVV